MKSSLLMNFSVDKQNHSIKVKREFAAPVSLVWSAWTKSDILDQWWAPKPWKARTKSMDFKEGGSWIYAMVGPDGSEHWSVVEYHTIDPSKSFSALDAFSDEKGNKNQEFPQSKWKADFKEADQSTFVNIRIQFENLADLEKIIEMGMREGFIAALENLDEILLIL